MATDDRRFNTYRWRKQVRLAVLRRDGWRCQVVEGCPRTGNNVDHIEPVYPGMPDWLFYSMDNLRAACRLHNVARYFSDQLVPGVTEQDEPEHTMSSLLHGVGPRRGVGLSTVVGPKRPRLPVLSPPLTIFGDYSRKPAKNGAA